MSTNELQAKVKELKELKIMADEPAGCFLFLKPAADLKRKLV